jgi:hypothetical protein
MAQARRSDDDDDDDLPPATGRYRESWDNDATAAAVRAVLDAFDDAPEIADDARMTLQRWLYRKDKFFGGGGAGQIAIILRVFLESDVNRDALVDPILRAVSWVAEPRFARHGLALLDAFDQIKLAELLATIRSLDIFDERSISDHLSVGIRKRCLGFWSRRSSSP